MLDDMVSDGFRSDIPGFEAPFPGKADQYDPREHGEDYCEPIWKGVGWRDLLRRKPREAQPDGQRRYCGSDAFYKSRRHSGYVSGAGIPEIRPDERKHVYHAATVALPRR
jgi:hypothetical protein